MTTRWSVAILIVLVIKCTTFCFGVTTTASSPNTKGKTSTNEETAFLKNSSLFNPDDHDNHEKDSQWSTEHFVNGTTQESNDDRNFSDTSSALERYETAKCACGLKHAGTEKIVGGSLAEERVWPWLAALIYVGGGKPKQFCGGSLINNLYILTAAHCAVDLQTDGLENYRIYLGTNLITSKNGTNVTQARISMVIVHPDFKSESLNSDIALIKLTNPIPYSDSIQPICLGQNGAPHIGKSAIVAGWGSLTANSFTVNALRHVNVTIVPNTKCAVSYSKIKTNITSLMICAALPKKDACQGDSGGPLFAKRTKLSYVYDQIGVVSFGQDCASKDFPGVYSRVGRFIPWIKNNTMDAIYCTHSFSKSNQ